MQINESLVLSCIEPADPCLSLPRVKALRRSGSVFEFMKHKTDQGCSRFSGGYPDLLRLATSHLPNLCSQCSTGGERCRGALSHAKRRLQRGSSLVNLDRFGCRAPHPCH